MKIKHIIWLAVIIFGIFFYGDKALAHGLIIIEGPIDRPPVDTIIMPHPRPVPRRPVTLPVKYHRVKVDINNGVATTSIDQVFKNPYSVDVEGTYIFPLPEEAAITDFAMYIDGKRVSGKVLDKDKARQVYEDIVRKMRDPGLLEYIGRNMFKARVYPIPKNGEKRIELVYKQTLEYDSGIYRYVYPLDTEKFSPKPLEEVTVSAHVKSKIPIKSIYSPSHDVDSKVEGNTATLGYEARNVTPDKNFILYYTVSEKDLGLNLLSYRQNGEDGYFMMLLSPGELEGKAIPKDIVFILDTSGSMSGNKIKQAKEALKFCINALGKDDRFNVVRFATDITMFRDGLTEATGEAAKQALDFIDKFEARGGTNINDALLSSMKMFNNPKRPRMMVFLTDGEPTVGVIDMKAIVKNLSGANETKARVFVFGVGNDVNTHLLDRISEINRGVSEYVVPKENIEVKVSAFYSKISEPILSDIKLDFGKIRIREMYPVTLPDIFKGTQLVLFGRYTSEGATAITLKGYVGGKEKTVVYEGTFPKENKENDFIPRIWATRKIGYLMNEIRLSGENKELVDEIIKLSKEHGIMTQYTSYLILEKEVDYRRWGFDEAAKEIRDQVSADGMAFKSEMLSKTGAGSVRQAKRMVELKESNKNEEPILETVKQVGAKTFYLRRNVWVDSKFKEGMKTMIVKYLSKEYFDILKRNPKLGKYFSLAKNITVVFEKKCYAVTE